MKVSELTDLALDWAVAKCEGRCTDIDDLDGVGWWVLEGNTDYQYSTRWSAGGPIIEQEGIRVCKADPTASVWGAVYSWGELGQREYFGTTPLIAAMRCYVASRLGDEVEIPEGLCSP